MYPGDEAVKQEQRQRKEEAQIRVSAPEQASIEASSTSGDLLPVIEADQQQRLQQRPALSDADLQRLPNVYLTDAWDTTYHHHFLGDHLFLTLDSGMFLDVQVRTITCACACGVCGVRLTRLCGGGAWRV
jgi:hypothetical protein